MKVSAVIPTRGNVDLTGIIDALAKAGIEDINVWDNSVEEDLGVYGRYAAIERAAHRTIFTQDDDCVLPPGSIRSLLGGYRPGKIAANMPVIHRVGYPDSCLVGFGSVFDANLPARAFGVFRDNYPDVTPFATQRFYRTCDVVFTALTPYRLLDVPVDVLPIAYGPDRMWKQPGHVRERDLVLKSARRIRRAVAKGAA